MQDFNLVEADFRSKTNISANVVSQRENSYNKNETNSKKNQDNAILFSNAHLLFVNGEFELSKNLLIKILNVNSFHPEALKLLAKIEMKNGNWDLLEKIYKSLLTVENCFNHVASLGIVYYHKGEDQKALKCFEEAITIAEDADPLLFEVYKNWGNILVKQGDFSGAEECYYKAGTLNTLSDALHVNLGTLAIQNSDFNLAAESFRQALSVNHLNDKAWVGLALVHNEMGDLTLALANVENAVDINPQNRTAVQLFAHWLAKTNNYTKAISTIQNYLSSVDLDEEMSLLLIHLALKMNDFKTAYFESERVLCWKPKNEEFFKIQQELKKRA